MLPRALQTTAAGPHLGRFEDIIDVRSPSEFAEDHIPGARNVPVLGDAERAEVGTVYRHDGAFAARRLGAAIITRNISRCFAEEFGDRGPGYRPLLYCWRGGQRSQSLATILTAVGWPAVVLEGGYRAYRSWARDGLEELCQRPGLEFVVVAGLTGSGKTDLLGVLAGAGHQVLDLEGLANHRGSVLGRALGDGAQPAQKAFENALFHRLAGVDLARPVFVESESNRIGALQLPGTLWGRLRAARVIELVAPAPARARFLLASYAHFVEDPAALKSALEGVRSHVGSVRLARWHGQIDRGEWHPFVTDLLESHYDPAYRRSRARQFGKPVATVGLSEITGAGLGVAAVEVARAAAAPAG